MKIENPSQMWILEDGIYTIKTFGEESASSLFNALPNTPYLANGNKVVYIGFLEGYGGTSIFSDSMLFVVLKGRCQTEKRNLCEKTSLFWERNYVRNWSYCFSIRYNYFLQNTSYALWMSSRMYQKQFCDEISSIWPILGEEYVFPSSFTFPQCSSCIFSNYAKRIY